MRPQRKTYSPRIITGFTDIRRNDEVQHQNNSIKNKPYRAPKKFKCCENIVVGNGIMFKSLEDNSTIGFLKLSKNQEMEYSNDQNTWISFQEDTVLTLNNDEIVYVRGVLTSDNSMEEYTQFKLNGKLSVSGDIKNISNYKNLNSPLKPYCFYSLFQATRDEVKNDEGKVTAINYYDNGLVDASELFLSENYLVNYCYGSMFRNCTNLSKIPNLPATHLAASCYRNLFRECHNLTEAPELPATILIDYCYTYMFYGCTSLTTAPELPATTLTEYCYYQMFRGCTNLKTAMDILPATTLASNCCYGMFYECTSLTKAPELPATNLSEWCYGYMFGKCTSLTTAPELPATTLADYCYKQMFQDCTSLTSAHELPATTLAPYCYQSMFLGCTSLTETPELYATTLAIGCYQYMFGNCTKLKTAMEILPALDLLETKWTRAGSLYSNFAAGTPNTETRDMTDGVYCGMFNGCKSLTKAPILPAKTLSGGSYDAMFYDCKSLTEIIILAESLHTNIKDEWYAIIEEMGNDYKVPVDRAWVEANASTCWMCHGMNQNIFKIHITSTSKEDWIKVTASNYYTHIKATNLIEMTQEEIQEIINNYNIKY